MFAPVYKFKYKAVTLHNLLKSVNLSNEIRGSSVISDYYEKHILAGSCSQDNLNCLVAIPS